jgi:transcription initiation factor TFIID subunit 9B
VHDRGQLNFMSSSTTDESYLLDSCAGETLDTESTITSSLLAETIADIVAVIDVVVTESLRLLIAVIPLQIPSTASVNLELQHIKLSRKIHCRSTLNTENMAEVNGDVPQTNGAHTSASPPSQPTVSAPSQPTATASSQNTITNPTAPLTSLQDNGQTKRPRDARLIHMLLSSLGCNAYQERVPLQLLDFAYRHSSSILSDALHLSSDAYISQQTRARDAPPGGGFREADGQVSAPAVLLAIQSRLQYQFGGGNGGGGLSKEFLLEQAMNRNKVALPRVLQNEWGVRLPSERFVLTGQPWGLKGEWVEREEDDGDTGVAGVHATVDVMEGVEMEEKGVEDEEGEGTMEDLFGGDADADMDKDME